MATASINPVNLKILQIQIQTEYSDDFRGDGIVQRENWKPFRLDQLGFVGRGRSRSRPRNDPTLYGGPYPLFETGDIKSADLYLSKSKKTYSEKGLAQSKLWNPDTLCITIAANIAETAILKIKACFPDSVVGFVADPEKTDVRYIKYYIDFIKLQMQNISQGTTQDNLSVEKLLSFDFCTPPLNTQRKIAAILSTYDDLIENNTRRIEILEEMAQAIYREWFVEFRFPGHEGVEMVESELGLIPQGWELDIIDELIDFKSGYAFKSNTFTDQGNYNIVTIKNVKDGEFQPVCDNRISNLPSNLPDHCHLKNGDILLSLTGYIGRVCLTYGKNYLLNQRVAKLVPNNPDHHPFFYIMFRQRDLQLRLETIATGVAQQNLSPIKAGKLICLVPSPSLLTQFSNLVRPYINQILNLNQKNANLRQTRDILLPKLISGEIDVSELDIDTN